MKISVTGGTGFVGGHVVRELVERGDDVRVTFRDERRLERLAAFDIEPIRADVLDRAAMRRAMKGCDLAFHTAGRVGSNPRDEVWQVNALGPRIAVEAAAAAGVDRVVVTSSVAGVGPAAPGEVGTEEDDFRAGKLGLTYVDSKHEGEFEALAAGAREGVEVVIVNPSYVLGVPVDRSQPGETSTRTIGNYMRGRLPAVVDGHTNIVDVRDVASGHLRAAEKGRPGERYILGGHDIGWVELIERVADLSGVQHPVGVIPRGLGEAARRGEALGLRLPISAEGLVLMELNWRYSSRKARGELGYRQRQLDTTLRDTIDWYRELIDSGAFGRARPTPLSLAADGMRLANWAGLLGGVRLAERYAGWRLVAGA
jgi:dihydroflavonol-4-reductase